jgi:hypothetical protein
MIAHFVALTKRIPSCYINFLIAIILRNISRYPLELQKGTHLLAYAELRGTSQDVGADPRPNTY